MAVLCPSCGLEPEGGVAGVPCGACGALFISVEEKPDPLIGQVIDGRFEVLAKLGAGGMGTVYRAKQRSIEREVAIKVIDRAAEADTAAIKRFYREAKLASQLSHPNTVGIIEFGQHDGRMYLAMELVKGRTLHAVVRAEGALPLWRVIRIGVQLCDALEAAHKLSIVHRDLKLENIMLLDESRDLVKILDFGLARSLVDPMSRATMTGVVAGTPRYLPPEVVLHAAQPTPAQDCYALGVIIGELSTGRELWRAATIDGLLAMKLNDAPNLNGVQPTLAAVIHGLLAPEPNDRPTAAVVRAELLAIKDEPKAPVKVTMPPPLAETMMAGASSELRVEVVAPPVTPVPAPVPAAAAAAAPRAGSEAMPHIRESQLVDLGEVARPPVEDTQVRAQPPGAGVPILPEEPTEVGLEIEKAWVDEREAKQAAAKRGPVPPPKPPFPIALAIGLVVAVAGLVAGGWYLASRHSSQSGTETVTLRITGDVVDVRVGGDKHGKPPVVVHIPKSGRELMVTGRIKGGQMISVNVTPDHDQDVVLSP